MIIQQAIRKYEGQPLTRQILLDLLKDYKRPNDKISELVKQQVLISVKKGIFIPGNEAHIRQPEPFLLANHLWGPSYVSMEAALSFWGFIPELVFEISSATITRSRTYHTPVGRYSYIHLPLPYFSFGQQSLEIAENQVVLIASPEKAICDKIITTSGLVFRSSVQMMEWMIEDMRMEKDMLRTLQANKISKWLKDSPKRRSLELLVKVLQSLQ
jgi:hypothetical protein